MLDSESNWIKNTNVIFYWNLWGSKYLIDYWARLSRPSCDKLLCEYSSNDCTISTKGELTVNDRRGWNCRSTPSRLALQYDPHFTCPLKFKPNILWDSFGDTLGNYGFSILLSIVCDQHHGKRTWTSLWYQRYRGQIGTPTSRFLSLPFSRTHNSCRSRSQFELTVTTTRRSRRKKSSRRPVSESWWHYLWELTVK